jgi:hypothetical protein
LAIFHFIDTALFSFSLLILPLSGNILCAIVIAIRFAEGRTEIAAPLLAVLVLMAITNGWRTVIVAVESTSTPGGVVPQNECNIQEYASYRIWSPSDWSVVVKRLGLVPAIAAFLAGMAAIERFSPLGASALKVLDNRGTVISNRSEYNAYYRPRERKVRISDVYIRSLAIMHAVLVMILVYAYVNCDSLQIRTPEANSANWSGLKASIHGVQLAAAIVSTVVFLVTAVDWRCNHDWHLEADTLMQQPVWTVRRAIRARICDVDINEAVSRHKAQEVSNSQMMLTIKALTALQAFAMLALR